MAKLLADRWGDELPRVQRKLDGISARGPGVTALQTPESLQILVDPASPDARGLWQPGHHLGKIVCRGPRGEADFTDERYWVRRQIPSNDENDGVDAALATMDDATRDSSELIFCVTNLAEKTAGTHAMTPGTLVVVFGAFDAAGVMRWYIPYGDPTDTGQTCPSYSSSSSSSSLSSSGSSSASSGSASGSSGALLYCGWYCDYDCATGKMGAVHFFGRVASISYTDWTRHTAYGDPGPGKCRYIKGTDPGGGDCYPAPAPPADSVGADCGCSSSSSSSSSPSSSGSSSSGGSSGSPSSSASGTSSSGSDKSTAIVPASWAKTGYTALFIAEAPEVRFDDVIVVSIPQASTRIAIDPRFVEVCQARTIEVCGCAADYPVAVGAKVEGHQVAIRFGRRANRKIRLVIRLSGIRKGFAGHRFPDRTRAQFEANERFIRSAYPDA